MAPTPRLLALGTIVRPHGLRGEVRLRAHDAGSRALAGLSRVFVRDAPGAAPTERALRRARPVPGGAWLLLLDAVDDIDQAEALRGTEVLALRDDLPPPEPGELFVADLVGCLAEDPSGRPLGEVVEVVDTGAQLLLTVRHQGRDTLVPLVDAFVAAVDVEARRLVLELPEGLPTEPSRS